MPFCTTQNLYIHIPKKKKKKKVHKSRVSDQNGISRLYIIVEIHHSGRKPSIYAENYYSHIFSCKQCLSSHPSSSQKRTRHCQFDKVKVKWRSTEYPFYFHLNNCTVEGVVGRISPSTKISNFWNCLQNEFQHTVRQY